MLDDLLAGVEGAQHFLADGLLGDALDEVVGDGEVDVGVEQGAGGPRCRPSRMFASVSRPRPRSFLRASPRPRWMPSNMVAPDEPPRGRQGPRACARR